MRHVHFLVYSSIYTIIHLHSFYSPAYDPSNLTSGFLLGLPFCAANSCAYTIGMSFHRKKCLIRG